jgi:hypothetical protein
VAFHLMNHLMREVVSTIKHGQQNPFDIQIRIEPVDQTDRFKLLIPPWHSIRIEGE